MPDTDREKRYADDYWDQSMGDYMSTVAILLHNTDYLEFLVTRVWKLDKPCRVVDFGCGAGRSGRMLMPLLPEGSTYTGIDQSAELLEEARRVFAGSPYEADFMQGDVHRVPFADDSYDVAFGHAVLMHIPDPMVALSEMIRVTRHGGMVITCDANRNAGNALLHVEELQEQETVPLDLIQTINREIRRQTGVDHNIGIKTPVLMHKAGLRNVQARLTDAVRLVLPPIEGDYAEAIFKAICEDGLGQEKPTEEQRAKWKAYMLKHGVSEEAAEREMDRVDSEDFLHRGRDFHTVYPSLLSFSFGTVDKQES